MTGGPSVLTGTGRLARLALRRDRVLLPVWVVAIAGLTGASLLGYDGAYRDEAQRVVGATFGAHNPLARVFDGPASGTELGAMVLVDAFKVLAILTALMSAQAVVRHTRQDEETGRAELVGSAVVGRHARLAAALLVALGADLVLGLTVVALLVTGGLPLSGSAAAGMATAGVGWAFAGVAAIAVQVASTARGANALVGLAVGVAFALRAVGDLFGAVDATGTVVVSAWPSWLSPIGWGQQVRPFHRDLWWIALLFVGLTAALVAVAVLLADRRDLGSALVRPGAGPARGGRGLRSALGLAWRLHRGPLLAWTLGMAVAGAAFGAVGRSTEDLVGGNDQIAGLFAAFAPGATVPDVYFAMLMAMVGVAAAGWTVQALLRMHAEEDSGRLEPVLAAGVGRSTWLAGHVMIAAAGTVGVLAVAGVAAATMHSLLTGAGIAAAGGIVAAALVQAPAALALGGLVVALVGALPRLAAPLSWAVLAAALVAGQLGSLLGLPAWALDLSPFTHLPRMPAEAWAAAPVTWLLLAALASAAVGVVAFRRRDLSIPA